MRTATKLKLMSRIETLEDMEASQSNQPAIQRHRHLPEKSPAPVARLPREHFHTAQILYQKDVYKDYPAWKRWTVEHLYMPIFRQFHKRLKLFPPTRMEPNGTYSWLMHQGCFLTKDEADADAARYPHGYVVPDVPVGQSLTASVNEDSAIYIPASKGDMAKLDILTSISEEVKRIKTIAHQQARAIQ